MDGKQTLRYVLIFVGVAALTVIYVDRRNLVGRYVYHEERDAQILAVEQQCAELDKQIETTRQRVENLKNDPLEIEAAIRRSKGLVREGEKVYRIQKAPGDAPLTVEQRP